MSKKRTTRLAPFKPFAPCPDCGAVTVQYCPWCGRNIHPGGHGVTGFSQGGKVYKLMTCAACVERMGRGEFPPFGSSWGLN